MPHAPEYRWPAEWEPQVATWISWPHNRITWPGYFDPVPEVFVHFVRELSKVQRVEVLSGPPLVAPAAEELLSGLENVTIHSVPTNDVWIRDFGPTFVKRTRDNALVGIDWQFNAWGGKYPPFDRDAAAAETICRLANCQRNESWLFCEGGGLETDGQGTLLTTSSVLLSETRNPNCSREKVEAELRRTLGVTTIVWVDGGGLAGDDTDGHIDQLARFVGPDTVVAAVSSTQSDSNHQGLAENLKQLQQTRSASGQLLNVIPLPIPQPRSVESKRVPESYCNFLIANGIVIVPTFRSPSTDTAALRLFEQLMPDRRVVPLDAFDLIWGLGAFHCASQQQPA
jgi:agmatine deiminase